MTSTRGRLFVLSNWEEISRLESFKNQEFYKQVFGFKFPSNKSDPGK